MIAKTAAKTALLAALALGSIAANSPASAIAQTVGATGSPVVTITLGLPGGTSSAAPDPAHADPRHATATAPVSPRADAARTATATTWHSAISEASGLRIRKSHPNGRILATVPLYGDMWVSCQQTGWYWVGYHHANRWIYGWSSAALIEINPDAAIPQC